VGNEAQQCAQADPLPLRSSGRLSSTLGLMMPAFFKTIVVALNALLLLKLLKAVLPSVWSQPSFISLFTLLLMVAPFATTIFYAVSVRNFFVWFISLGANLLIAFLVAGFTLFLGNISGGHNSSFGGILIALLAFIGILNIINVAYLLWWRPRRTPVGTSR
jgi:hypothetical protein